jgi:hypothetical protein
MLHRLLETNSSQRACDESAGCRVRAQEGLFNGERVRAPTPGPARPFNDENMEPEVPRMRSIPLEPRPRPFFEDGGGAAAPPHVFVRAGQLAKDSDA